MTRETGPATAAGTAPDDARERGAVYLDHAAATPLLPEVAAAMEEVRESGFANPSSPHAAGRRARRILEAARERILALAGGDLGPGSRLVFTSGATEANRLAILGMAASAAEPARGRILFSARDHAGVATAARELETRGWAATRVPLLADGTLDLGRIPPGGVDETPILCATLVCGQSGAREDVAAVTAWAAAAARTRVHVDATQAIFAAAPGAFGLPQGLAATLAFAPHKFGGPRGIGGLVIRREVAIGAVVPGSQEAGLRGGTEPVALAVGFATALETARRNLAETARRLAVLRDHLEGKLVAAADAAGIEARVVAVTADRAPHLATVAFVGLDRQAFVMGADLAGVCCATGTACASGSSEPAPALAAMGLPAGAVAGAVRFSLGATTSADDVDRAVERLAAVIARMAPRARA